MKRIKHHLLYPKMRQIVYYSPYFYIQNALFTALPKSHLDY